MRSNRSERYLFAIALVAGGLASCSQPEKIAAPTKAPMVGLHVSTVGKVTLHPGQPCAPQIMFDFRISGREAQLPTYMFFAGRGELPQQRCAFTTSGVYQFATLGKHVGNVDASPLRCSCSFESAFNLFGGERLHAVITVAVVHDRQYTFAMGRTFQRC